MTLEWPFRAQNLTCKRFGRFLDEAAVYTSVIHLRLWRRRLDYRVDGDADLREGSTARCRRWLCDLLGGLLPFLQKIIHFGFGEVPFSPPNPAFNLLLYVEEAGFVCGVMSRAH